MRQLGITVAVVALLVLSGREAAPFETEKGRHDTEIRNDDTSSHRVLLEVVDEDGDTVRKGSRVLAAGGTWNANRLAHAGEYTTRVTVADGDGEYVDTVSIHIEGEDTLSVSVIRINRDDSVTGETTVRGTVEPRVDGFDRA